MCREGQQAETVPNTIAAGAMPHGSSQRLIFHPLSEELIMSTALRKKMHQDLQLAGLSEGTQGSYLRVLRQLAVHYHTPPDRLTEQQVRDYLLHLKNDKKSASSTLGIAYSAIKFFYSHTVPRDWPTLQRIRVQKEKRLPDVLTIDEVRQLIGAVRNSASGPISQR